MEVYEVAINRRSIREFKDTPVPYDVLEKCVDAARLAPTAANRQLCEHVIIDDRDLLLRVFGTIRTWMGENRPAGDWPPGRRPMAYIVTLINSELENTTEVKRINTMCDAGMAVENMALVACEYGLGSCVVRSYEEDELKELLNIPDKYEVGLMLALGYPDETIVVTDYTDSHKLWVDSKGIRHVPKKRLADILHRNRF
jgi:nitroreductase